MDQHDRIRAARTAAHLTQQQVADACGITREAVAQWESRARASRTQPTTQNFITLARITPASLEWLTTGTGPAPENAGARESAISREEPTGAIDTRRDASTAANIDTELLAGCIEAAADAFRAQGALADQAAVAEAAVAMYGYVIAGRTMAEARDAVDAELARFGTSRASASASSNRGKRRGQAERRTAAYRHSRAD